MCSVSAVSDYYMRQYPVQNPLSGTIQGFGGTHVVTTMDPEAKEMLRKAVALLDKIDKKLGDIDCKDEEKAAFLAALKKPRRSKRAGRGT